MVTHCIEYSRSSRAKCHGTLCKGSLIGMDELRYGHTVKFERREIFHWRHWRCVTPDILRKLPSNKLGTIVGYYNLRDEDKERVKLAISTKRVDQPVNKQTQKTGAAVPSSSQGTPSMSTKRKVSDMSGPSSSQRPTSAPSGTYHVVDDDIEILEEESHDELYCSMHASIVGVQYYIGLVGPEEEVILVREPHNKYDRNAIQVMNIGRTQVGHLPRAISSKLSPLMDQGLVTAEGIMHAGNLVGFSYTLSMTLKIYGASDKRDRLEPLLIWATPGQRGFPRGGQPSSSQAPAHTTGSTSTSGSRSGPSSTQHNTGGMSSSQAQAQARQEAIRKQQEALRKAAELKQMLSNLEKVDDEGRRTSLLDTLCSKDDILNLPLHPSPPGIRTGELKVDLLKHQSQALKWCIEHENPVLPQTEADKPVQFWQFRKNGNKPYYYNIATKTPQESPPPLGCGALCADSMGLGKTLVMISLILVTKEDNSVNFCKTTLIVVPLSIMSNWEKQIQDHCTPGALSFCVYYGTNRSMTPEELAQYDVVITTYQTVSGEHPDSGKVKGEGEPSKKKKKIQGSLFDVPWKRIILDEGHQIRNPRTKTAQAVFALNGDRRWVLSGTPIINSPQDLGSILTFLRICRPLDNADFYKRLLLRPLKDGDPVGVELLRALMSHVCIRRTKEMQDSQGNYLVPLPPVEMTVVPVALNDEARKLYDAVESMSQLRVEKIMNHVGGMNPMVQSNVLSMLTRLRQLALHPGLVPSNYLEQLQSSEVDGKAAPAIILTPQDRMRLQNLLAQIVEDNEECPICFSILTDPRITSCAHPFCLACIKEVLSRDARCPMDRRPITMGDLVEPLPSTELTQAPVQRTEDNNSGIRGGSSSKIDQLIHLLKLTPAQDKSLVFSQFTSFLDKIAETLDEHGIPYVRFDGKMSAKRRQETLERFSIPIEEASPSTYVEPIPSTQRCQRKSKQFFNIDDVGLADDSSDGDFDITGVDVANDSDDVNYDDNDKRKGKKKATATNSGTSLRDELGDPFGDRENPKVMLISLKAGALGLNLTVANNVYLMDPWWQEGIESQAIDRCNRIGQTKPVHVYQLIAENTVESKVIEIQERKKALVQQAFSGIKRTETQRQKKEARLQDLIELFGIRQRASG